MHQPEIISPAGAAHLHRAATATRHLQEAVRPHHRETATVIPLRTTAPQVQAVVAHPEAVLHPEAATLHPAEAAHQVQVADVNKKIKSA
jgi:hypothetical protein